MLQSWENHCKTALSNGDVLSAAGIFLQCRLELVAIAELSWSPSRGIARWGILIAEELNRIWFAALPNVYRTNSWQAIKEHPDAELRRPNYP